MVQIFIGSEIRKPNHLKYGQTAAILSETIWNLDKNVPILNGLVFKWLAPLSGFWMVGFQMSGHFSVNTKNYWGLGVITNDLRICLSVCYTSNHRVCWQMCCAFQSRTIGPFLSWRECYMFEQWTHSTVVNPLMAASVTDALDVENSVLRNVQNYLRHRGT